MLSLVYKQKQYEKVYMELDYVYTKERLLAICQRTIVPFVNDHTVDVVNQEGVHRPLSHYAQILKKSTGVTKHDLRALVAMVLSDYQNVEIWQSLLDNVSETPTNPD